MTQAAPTTEMVILAAFQAALATAQNATTTPRAGNTGNGTVQNLNVLSGAALGVYVLTITGDATTFGLLYPSGAPVMDNQEPPAPVVGTVGRRLTAGGLDFYLVAGTAAFVAGDGIAITTLAGTSAGARVYVPRDWPAKPDQFPMLVLHWPREHKESWGPNAPAFNTTTTIRVEGRVASKAGSGDAGAAAALAALGILKRQIEVALINNGPLYRIINQIAAVDSAMQVTAQGEYHLGELTMDFAVEYPQVTQDFAPVPAWPLQEIDIFADLLNVASPTGDYAPPFPYEVTPSPRTIGPDGRVEVRAVLPLEGD